MGLQEHSSLDQQLCETRRERDELRGRLDNMQLSLSAAEAARDESVARVVKLEQSVLSRNERLREDAERWSQQLQHVQAVLAAFHGDDLEADGESDVAEAVRCLIRTLQEKTSVCCFYDDLLL